MKKYFMIFTTALTFLAACQEEITPEINTNPDEILNYPIDITFVASNEAGTKTVINDEQITWESDDEIKVLWSNTGSNKAIAEPYNENTCAQFTTKVEEADAYYAVHPYAATSSYVDGNIVVKVPAVQGGEFENANIAVAKANEDNAFLFRHLVGMIEFTTDTPGKVTISGAEGDVLTGTVTVTGFDENGYPQYNEDKVTDASSVIEIDVKTSGTYYAAFLPSATLKCLSVKVEGNETTEYALSANQLKMARGKVIELGNIDIRFGKNLFVTASADGNGDGKTWETALTYQQMANMIAAVSAEGPNAPSGDTNTALDNADPAYLEWHNGERAAALNGITFHIAEGTYKTSNYVRVSFPGRESAVKLSFKGGYSSDSKGTDLSKRFVNAEDVTTVTGEKARRHFFVRYSSNVTFDGITFTEGYTTASGGSILFNESETSTLNLKNCKFISNEAKGSNGGAICGGGSAAIGKAVVVDCIFDANTSNAGGAIYANDGIWNLTNCTISNNGSAGAGGALYLSEDAQMSVSGGSLVSNVAVTNGGAAYASCEAFSADDVDFISNKGELTAADNSQGGAIYFANTSSGNERNLINCLFKENSVDAAKATTDNYVRGGAIYIQASSPNVVFTNCTFESNKQLNAKESYKKHGGGAIYATKSFTATGCTFKTNDAYQFGAIGIEGGSASINGTFVSNTAVTGGAVGTVSGTPTYTSCVFTSNSATNGGAVTATGGTTAFSKCEFSQNTSSSYGGVGYVANNNASLSFTDCDIDSNSSVNNGGAFHFNPIKKATYTDCDITSNAVTGANMGGAFYLSGGSAIDITRGTINNNSTGKIGGAFYSSNKETVVIDGTTISGNQAKNGEGGAIRFVGAGNWTIKNATISNNTATSNGGAIYAHTGKLNVTGTTFTGNSSNGTVGGGAIYLTTNAVLSVSGSTFTKNNASNDAGAYGGGAICISGSAPGVHMINGCIFSENQANQGAAVKVLSGATMYMNACSFTKNNPRRGTTGGVIHSAAKSFINNCSFYSNVRSDLIIVGNATTMLNSTINESETSVTDIRVYYNNVTANLYNNVLLNPNSGDYGTVRVGYHAEPGSITSQGYNYTTEWMTLVDSGVAGSVTMAETDKVVNYTDVSGNFTSASTTDGHGYYTWTKPADVTGTSAANVTAFLAGIAGGSDFATWLGTVDGLTKDIAGNSRPATGWYPGCYQGN